MNRLFALIRPRLLLAEGLLLLPVCVAMSLVARHVCAWQHSWTARVTAQQLAAVMQDHHANRSPLP